MERSCNKQVDTAFPGLFIRNDADEADMSGIDCYFINSATNEIVNIDNKYSKRFFDLSSTANINNMLGGKSLYVEMLAGRIDNKKKNDLWGEHIIVPNRYVCFIYCGKYIYCYSTEEYRNSWFAKWYNEHSTEEIYELADRYTYITDNIQIRRNKTTPDGYIPGAYLIVPVETFLSIMGKPHVIDMEKRTFVK